MTQTREPLPAIFDDDIDDELADQLDAETELEQKYQPDDELPVPAKRSSFAQQHQALEQSGFRQRTPVPKKSPLVDKTKRHRSRPS